MIIVIGLVLLVAALIVGVAGVLGNSGGAHALTSGFSVLGYHVTGSTGVLFLYGMVVGAAAVLGLGLLLAAARRSSRRGRAARRQLKQSRREIATVRQDRDHLIDQRETVGAETASADGIGATPRDELNPNDSRRPRRHLFGRGTAPRPASAGTPQMAEPPDRPTYPAVAASSNRSAEE